jgi:fumarylacetoacetase
VGSPDGGEPRVLARFGDRVIDLHVLEELGLFDGVEGLDEASGGESRFGGRSLNPFLSLGPRTWQALDEKLTDILTAPPPSALGLLEQTRLDLPIEVADFCDFYASEYHASNMGRILRPGSEPLPPSWRRIPLGYHGRAGTVVVSGSPVRRPTGVIATPDGATSGPSARLDLEVELGYVVGVGSNRGEPVAVEDALDHLFGVVVLNDWSARDIQAFEYQPLGPFLGKSFATSISPWVVPIRRLSEHRVDGPVQGDEVGPNLRTPQPRGFDIDLELSINSTVVSRPEARYLHWSPEQLVAHLTSNGASLRTGDLLGTGTISGPDNSSWGSLMELGWGGQKPFVLDDGSTRSWLCDGDTVTISAWLGDGTGSSAHLAGSSADRAHQGAHLGEVTGTVLAARSG